MDWNHRPKRMALMHALFLILAVLSLLSFIGVFIICVAGCWGGILGWRSQILPKVRNRHPMIVVFITAAASGCLAGFVYGLKEAVTPYDYSRFPWDYALRQSLARSVGGIWLGAVFGIASVTLLRILLGNRHKRSAG